jgi:nitrogen fixation protein FixH
MIHYALSSFRGEVADHPYEAGLAFNSDIAAARAQEARNWKVDVDFNRSSPVREFDVSAHDAQGRPVSGLSFAGVFAAPVDATLDRRVELEEKRAGVYSGEIPVVAGYWDLELTAKRGGVTLFQSKNRVVIR